MTNKQLSTSRGALHPVTICVMYLVVGLLYIAFSDRLVLQLLDDPETISLVQTTKGWGFIIVTSVLLYLLIRRSHQDIRASEARARAADIRARRMIEISNDGVLLLDTSGTIRFANSAFGELVGDETSRIIGRLFDSHLDPQSHEGYADQIQRIAAGQRAQFEVCLRRPVDEPCWAIASGASLPSADGEPVGVLLVITDISDRKITEQLLEASNESYRSLLNELDHRVRNNLSSMLTLVDMCRARAKDVDDFAGSISHRLEAMNVAHTLLSDSNWSPQSLGGLVSAIVPLSHRARVLIDGPEARIPAAKVVPLLMTLNELVRNSIEYGSLQHDDGRLEVRWSFEQEADPEQRTLRIEWVERMAEGQTISETDPPAGLGLQLVEGLVRSDLQGEVMLRFEPTGARHVMTIPIEAGDDSEASPPCTASASSA